MTTKKITKAMRTAWAKKAWITIRAKKKAAKNGKADRRNAVLARAAKKSATKKAA